MDMPGAVFVTTTVRKFAPIFRFKSTALIITDYLTESVRRGDLFVFGYVVMPHHVHCCLGLNDIRELSQAMKSFKSVTSRRISALGIEGVRHLLDQEEQSNIWMPRFDDVVVFSEKQFRIKLNYIHENPVRAKLCACETDWALSSASDWLLDTPGPVPITKDFAWLKRE